MEDTRILREAGFWQEGSRIWLAAACRDGGGLPYEEAMLTGMQHEAFLPFQVRYQDEEKYYLYETTGKASLSAHLARCRADHETMIRIIRSIIGAADAAEEYLLDINAIVTDPDLIFMDLSDPQLSFIYLPGWQGDFNDGLGDLAAKLLAGADHRDQDCILLVYDFFRIVREDDFCLSSLKTFAAEEIKPVTFAGPESPDEKAPVRDLPLFDAEDVPPLKEIKKPDRPAIDLRRLLPAVLFAAVSAAALAAYFTGCLDRLCQTVGWQADVRIMAALLILASGLVIYAVPLAAGRFQERKSPQETDDPVWFRDEPEDEQTQLLEPEPLVILERVGAPDLPDIRIGTFPAVIGSLPVSDILLDGNGVSRRHAVITREGGEVRVRDEHSTNGTFVNGRRLLPEETVPLCPGDTLTIAGIRLRFVK